MAQFRFLHISDLHLSSKLRGADALERLRYGYRRRRILGALFGIWDDGIFSGHDRDLAGAIAEFAVRHRSSLDGILITGDLATTGINSDLKVARAFLDGQGTIYVRDATAGATLAASGLPVVVLPGNHDRYLSEWGDAGGAGFDAEFSPYWQVGARVQEALFSREGVSLGIVCADFSLRINGDARVPVSLGQLGQGRVYRDTLEEMSLRTRKFRERATGILWAVHFPPGPPGGSRWLHLIDGQTLVAAAQECDVHHVLAGHIHQDLTYLSNGQDVAVLCANSGCSSTLDGGNGFQVLEVNVDASNLAIVELAYIWDDGIGNFRQR